jgi:hypothetical protein
MSTCAKCHHTNTYTSYIKVLVRSKRTHHPVQQFVKAGMICMDCNHFTKDWDETLKHQDRKWNRGVRHVA